MIFRSPLTIINDNKSFLDIPKHLFLNILATLKIRNVALNGSLTLYYKKKQQKTKKNIPFIAMSQTARPNIKYAKMPHT